MSAPATLRTGKQRGRARVAAPYVSNRPWAGFTAHDSPRPQPLAHCPSARCRRAKQCIATLDNLYCLRTHHGLVVLQAIQRSSPLQRDLDMVSLVIDPDDMSEQIERLKDMAAVRRGHDEAMLERWKAGEFGRLYGPYRCNGVVLRPPPKVYIDERRRAPSAAALRRR